MGEREIGSTQREQIIIVCIGNLGKQEIHAPTLFRAVVNLVGSFGYGKFVIAQPGAPICRVHDLESVNMRFFLAFTVQQNDLLEDIWVGGQPRLDRFILAFRRTIQVFDDHLQLAL